MPERIEWLMLIVYEPATGRVALEEEGELTRALGYLKEGLQPEIARRLIKAKLAFL
jgi:hypothetical protein